MYRNHEGRFTLETGISRDGQLGEFQNATLQDTAGDPNVSFSVAVYVEIPKGADDSMAATTEYLRDLFDKVVGENPELHVAIQLGLDDESDEDGEPYEYRAPEECPGGCGGLLPDGCGCQAP